MKKKERKIQLILIATGLLLFVLTYFYYPTAVEEKSGEKVLIDKNFKKVLKCCDMSLNVQKTQEFRIILKNSKFPQHVEKILEVFRVS